MIVAGFGDQLATVRLSTFDCSTGTLLCDHKCQSDVTAENEWHELFSVEVLQDNVIALFTVESEEDWGHSTALIYRVDDEGQVTYQFTDSKNYYRGLADANHRRDVDLLLRSGVRIGFGLPDGNDYLTTGSTLDDKTLSVAGVDNPRSTPNNRLFGDVSVELERPDLIVVGDNTILLSTGLNGQQDKLIVCNLIDIKDSAAAASTQAKADEQEQHEVSVTSTMATPVTEPHQQHTMMRIESFYRLGNDSELELGWATRWTKNHFVVLYDGGPLVVYSLHTSAHVRIAATFTFTHPVDSHSMKARRIPHNKLLLLDSYSHRSYELYEDNDTEASTALVQVKLKELPYKKWILTTSRQSCPKYKQDHGLLAYVPASMSTSVSDDNKGQVKDSSSVSSSDVKPDHQHVLVEDRVVVGRRDNVAQMVLYDGHSERKIVSVPGPSDLCALVGTQHCIRSGYSVDAIEVYNYRTDTLRTIHGHDDFIGQAVTLLYPSDAAVRRYWEPIWTDAFEEAFMSVFPRGLPSLIFRYWEPIDLPIP